MKMGIPWCALFINKIVLISQTRKIVNDKLELWKGFISDWSKIRRLNIEYTLYREQIQ